MGQNYCGICGKSLDDGTVNICLGCGETICYEDYDNMSGYCINCSDNFPYCGC